METRTRKILFLISSLIFIILTPSLIFYSQGYRFDWQSKRWVKTGNLYLVSYPSGALVFLDHKLYQAKIIEQLLFYKNLFKLTKLHGRTPTLINYLYPKEYLVTVKKDGYFSWQKRVKIIPEKTTIFREIMLFQNQPEISFVENLSLTHFKFSPRLRKVSALDNSGKEIIIVDLETNQKKKIELKNKIKNFFWFPSEEKLMISIDNSDYPLFLNLTNHSFINLKDLLKQKIVIQNIKIFGEERVSFCDQRSIYQLDLVTKKLDLLYYLKEKTSSLIDFVLEGNVLFYLKKKENKFFLEGLDLETKKIFYSLEIPITENYKFTDRQEWLKKFIFLQDQENFLIFDWREKEFEKALVLKVKAKNFDFNHQKIFYQDGYEISSFNLITKKKEIIDRTSKKILKILSHPRGNYLFVLFPQKIKILEIDYGLPINYVEYNFEEVVDLVPLKNNDGFIYLVGQLKKEKGIFKIKIQ